MNKSCIAAALISAFAFTTSAAPLKILIVNDDGCESTGSISLQEKLTQKGFDVWMVAPATNQSGIGSAITFKTGKIFDVKKAADKRYCFPGTPADAVDFGLRGILINNPPDLVISGVNDGPNTGMAQVNSGTVSAAARAFRYAAANALGGHLSMVFLARACCFCWYHPHRFTLLSADLPVDDAVLSRFSGCA